jgi:hypothetical protein
MQQQVSAMAMVPRLALLLLLTRHRLTPHAMRVTDKLAMSDEDDD